MSLVPVLSNSPCSLCIAPSSYYLWTLALLSFYFSILNLTHLFTVCSPGSELLSQGNLQYFFSDLSIEVSPSINCPGTSLNFFLAQVFADRAFLCVSSQVLASQQNCSHHLQKSRLYIYMNHPFVSDSVRSNSQDSSFLKKNFQKKRKKMTI